MFTESFKQYKNIVLAVIIAVAVTTIGVAGAMKYFSMVKTITELTTSVEEKDKTINDLNKDIGISKGNEARLGSDLDRQNHAVANMSVELNTTKQAYNTLKQLTVEQRYGANSNITKVYKTDMPLHDLIRTISEIRYEDL